MKLVFKSHNHLLLFWRGPWVFWSLPTARYECCLPSGPPGVPPVNGICDTVTFVQYNVCHTIHSDISTTTKVSLCLLGLAAADFSFTLMLKIETWRLTILTNFLCGDKTLCNIHQPGYTRLVYIGSIATVNYRWTGITYGDMKFILWIMNSNTV